MISCLQNYVGLIGVNDTPDSGRFINDLAGITTNRFDSSYDSDDNYEPTEAWAAVERVAINRFEQRMMRWAKRFFLNYSYIGTTISGQYRNTDSLSASNEYVGVMFNYDFLTQQSLSIKVQNVHLWSDSDTTTTIRAYNAATGELLKTKDVNLTEGDNKIYIGWEFPVWRYTKVFIAYDAEFVTSLEQNQYRFSSRTNLQYKKVSKAATVIDDNLQSTGDQNGLIVQFSVVCSLDNYVCQRLSLFQEAYLYCLGSELLKQSIHSENINRYTLLDYEQAQVLEREYDVKFNEMMEDALTGMTMDDDGICFVCNRAVNYRPMLP